MDIIRRVSRKFPVDTLLRRFILHELASHAEPVRRGKSRGELIGLRREKFFAAVLCGVTNLPLKEIAKISAVPYGSLRNWMADNQFTNVADGELGAFSVMAMQYLTERIAVIRKAENEGGDFYTAIAKEPPVFDDAKFYRENVCRQISWLFFRTFTSAAALIGCPNDLFNRVMGLIFGAQMLTKETEPWSVRRMVERTFLDRVNEYLRLNSRQLQPKVTLDPMIGNLIVLYIELEAKYQEDIRKAR